MGRAAPLTCKPCILYIYSTNTGTEYFKHALYSPFFSLENAVCFIMLTYLVPVLFTFYIILYTGCAKIKKINSGTKRLIKLLYVHNGMETVRFKFSFPSPLLISLNIPPTSSSLLPPHCALWCRQRETYTLPIHATQARWTIESHISQLVPNLDTRWCCVRPRWSRGSALPLTLIVLMWRIGWAHNNARK